MSSRGKFVAISIHSRDTEELDLERLETRAVNDTEYGTLFVAWLASERIFIDTAGDQSDGSVRRITTPRLVFLPATGRWSYGNRKPPSLLLSGGRWTASSHGNWRIALIFGLLFAMTFRLSRRINAAVQAAERVARGDLTDEDAVDGSRRTRQASCCGRLRR